MIDLSICQYIEKFQCFFKQLFIYGMYSFGISYMLNAQLLFLNCMVMIIRLKCPHNGPPLLLRILNTRWSLKHY